MLNAISWQGYWTSIALLTAAYYITIYCLYVRRDFKNVFSGRQSHPESPIASPSVASFLKEQAQPSLFDQEKVEEEFSLPSDPTEQSVYACMDELTAYFAGAKKGKVMTAEVLFAVQRILRKHPLLNESDYKESITGVIQTEAAHHCSVHLSREELNRVWLKG